MCAGWTLVGCVLCAQHKGVLQGKSKSALSSLSSQWSSWLHVSLLDSVFKKVACNTHECPSLQCVVTRNKQQIQDFPNELNELSKQRAPVKRSVITSVKTSVVTAGGLFTWHLSVKLSVP